MFFTTSRQCSQGGLPPSDTDGFLSPTKRKQLKRKSALIAPDGAGTGRVRKGVAFDSREPHGRRVTCLRNQRRGGSVGRGASPVHWWR